MVHSSLAPKFPNSCFPVLNSHTPHGARELPSPWSPRAPILPSPGLPTLPPSHLHIRQLRRADYKVFPGGRIYRPPTSITPHYTILYSTAGMLKWYTTFTVLCTTSVLLVYAPPPTVLPYSSPVAGCARAVLWEGPYPTLPGLAPGVWGCRHPHYSPYINMHNIDRESFSWKGFFKLLTRRQVPPEVLMVGWWDGEMAGW